VFDESETLVRTVLAPYAPVLYEIPHAAWTRLQLQEDRTSYSATTRANVVSSFMLERARELLVPMGVRELDNHVSSIFLIEDQVVIRFKHLDSDGLSQNYQTPRAQMYNSPELTLPGIPAAALRVDVGYRLNVIETAIANVMVTHRSRKRVQWAYELLETGAGTVPVQLPLDQPAAAEVVLPRVRRRADGDAKKILKFRQATDDE
jgi:hypothetical protein